jgi:WD40 repeat protein
LHAKLVGMEQNLAHVLLIKSRDSRGQKLPVNCITYNKKGDSIISGCTNGTIQSYDLRITSRPSLLIPQAHLPGSAISHLKVYRDGTRFVSRGMDDTMRLWDVR